ncbi:MAG TPA: DMT family transporter [Sphingomicrobium sp.]|nr:DMT family transporter [Sphingomicrobium sp.]
MSPGPLVAAFLVLCGGAMLAVQAPTNALLARAGGSPVLAALISFGVGTIALFIVWILSGNRPNSGQFAALPWYAWLGGLYGAFFVAIAAYGAPRIGLAQLITISIAGQIAIALWLDHTGALGLPREPINFGRLVGAMLVVAGVILVRRN